MGGKLEAKGKIRTGSRALFEDGDGENHELLKINKEFAKKFESRKDKEEMQRLMANPKLRNKMLRSAGHSADQEASTDDSSEDEEDEDSDAELVTQEVGAKVLETLSRIQLRRTEIYDKNKKFFDDEDFQEIGEKKKQHGPLTFTRFMSSTLKEEGAEAFVRDEEEVEARESETLTSTYEEEQKALKKVYDQLIVNLYRLYRFIADMLKAFLTAADDIVGHDDLLQVREKSEGERREDDLSFREFLKKRAIKKAGDETQLLERYFQANEELNKDDSFLRDYILYERWKEGNQMPQGNMRGQEDEDNEDEDEKNMEETNQFEAAYNFRFEEGEAPVIEGHARKVLDSVRAKDDKRRRKRQERLERKKGEKEEKRGELERLKYLKRKELIERLKVIQRIAGIKCDLDPARINFDEEFDEKEHEAQMTAILGEDFEEQKEPEENEDQLLEIPEELVEVTKPKTPTGKLSAKQMKRIEKLAKKQAKLRALEADDGNEAYPPVLDGEGQAFPPELNDGDLTYPSELSESQNADDHNEVLANCDANEDGEPLWYLCDGCQYGITGGAKRYDCTVCDNFTLCTKCFRNVRHPHQLTQKRVPPHCMPAEDYLDGTRRIRSACGEIGIAPAELPDESEMTEEQRAMFNDMIDEYYSLEYEDIIGGDLPVRFKYAKVAADDYGLTTDEILTKSDKQLNQHISLKKLAPYRQGYRGNSNKINHYHDNYKNNGKQISQKRKSENFNNDGNHVMKKTKKELEVLKNPIAGIIDEDRLAAYGVTHKTTKHEQKKRIQKKMT